LPPGTYPEQWDLAGLTESLDVVLGLAPPIDEWFKEDGVDQELMIERIGPSRRGDGHQDLRGRAGALAGGREDVLIQTLDHHWKEHLATLDALRQVIHLRSYAQKKPIDEYKSEAFCCSNGCWFPSART
jgi:preprotein translocase subunit SecA